MLQVFIRSIALWLIYINYRIIAYRRFMLPRRLLKIDMTSRFYQTSDTSATDYIISLKKPSTDNIKFLQIIKKLSYSLLTNEEKKIILEEIDFRSSALDVTIASKCLSFMGRMGYKKREYILIDEIVANTFSSLTRALSGGDTHGVSLEAIANIIGSLVNLQYGPWKDLPDKVSTILLDYVSESMQSNAPGVCAHATDILQSMGKMGWRYSMGNKRLQSSLQTMLSSEYHIIDIGADISKLLLSLSSIQFPYNKLPTPAVENISRGISAHVSNLTEIGLVNIVYAMGKMEISWMGSIDEDLKDKILRQLTLLSPTMSIASVASITWYSCQP